MTTPENAAVRPFPIARVDGDPTGRTLLAMNTSTIVRPVPFTVLATSPEEDRSVGFVVSAISPHEARRAARAELAKERRDDWSIEVAPKCEGMAICTGVATIDSGDFGRVCMSCMRAIENTVGS